MQTEKSGRLRGCGEEGGGARHSLYYFSRASYLTLLLRRKTPTASSRCDVGLQKFIKSALQAGYSRQKERAWCAVATNAQPVSLMSDLKIFILMKNPELKTCKHSLLKKALKVLQA